MIIHIMMSIEGAEDFWRKICDCIALSSAVYSIRNFKKQCSWLTYWDRVTRTYFTNFDEKMDKSRPYWRKYLRGFSSVLWVFFSSHRSFAALTGFSKLWQLGFLIRAGFPYFWKYFLLSRLKLYRIFRSYRVYPNMAEAGYPCGSGIYKPDRLISD